jgi:hypothetical protein
VCVPGACCQLRCLTRATSSIGHQAAAQRLRAHAHRQGRGPQGGGPRASPVGARWRRAARGAPVPWLLAPACLSCCRAWRLRPRVHLQLIVAFLGNTPAVTRAWPRRPPGDCAAVLPRAVPWLRAELPQRPAPGRWPQGQANLLAGGALRVRGNSWICRPQLRLPLLWPGCQRPKQQLMVPAPSVCTRRLTDAPPRCHPSSPRSQRQAS